MQTPIRSSISGLIWLIGFAQFACLAAPPAALPLTSPVARPALLRDDPLLQQKITLEVTDQPLSVVLARLSPILKLDLTVSSKLGEQRVTLNIKDQPVYVFMADMLSLFSHSPTKPRGYSWGKVERPATARPAYDLWRDAFSVQQEKDELDYPRREAAVMLRNLRDLCRMTPGQLEKYSGDYPYNFLPIPVAEQPFGHDQMPMAKALRDLTDDQLDFLMQGGKIPLDPALFAEEMEAAKQKQRDYETHERELDELLHSPDRYPNGIPEPVTVPPILSVKTEGDNNSLADAYVFDVRIDGLQLGMRLDPYDTTQNPDPSRLARFHSFSEIQAAKTHPKPVFDLTALLKAKSVTPEQRGDVGFTLQALAKTAHLTIYQEDFLKAGSQGFRSPGIKVLKGSLSDLILEIGEEWNYQALKMGDTYFFWSTTWARDRAADIPDRLIQKWQARLHKQGCLTLDDHAEIAAALTWPQMKLTLGMVLPEGCAGSLQSYKMYRLLGRFSSSERSAAFSPEGLALADLSPWEQQAFADDFQQELSRSDSQALSQAVITFRTEYTGPPNTDKPREIVVSEIKSNGILLAGARDSNEQAEPTVKPAAVIPVPAAPVPAQ